jgi:hypothetical protein
MTSIEEQWAHGTPDRAVADAFSALRRRDVARLAAGATSASIRALAARVGPELDARDSRTPASSTGELTDSQAASTLGRLVARLPEFFTDSVRCLIVGHVLESRLVDASPVAHVVFRVAHEFPGQGIVPFPPELQIATTELIGGEWKLILDEWSDFGLPGFRGVGFWIDEGSTTEAATDD